MNGRVGDKILDMRAIKWDAVSWTGASLASGWVSNTIKPGSTPISLDQFYQKD